MKIKMLCFSALALTMSVAAATTTEAKGPDIKERFSEDVDEIDEFLSFVCGFEVSVSGNVSGTFRGYDDGRIHVTERGKIVLTNTENGRTLTNTWRSNLKGQGTESVDGSILTINFTDAVTGIPDRWLDDNGKTLIFDRGRAVISGEVVIDLAAEELISESFDFTVNGPHPILEQGFLDPEQACERLT